MIILGFDIITHILLYINDSYKKILLLTSKSFNKYIDKNIILSVYDIINDNININQKICILQWLFKNNKIPKKICNLVVKKEYLDIIKLLNDNNCLWDEEIFADASITNNLNIIKLLYSNGCPWNEESTSNAAIYGNLDILIWLHENGCPWDEDLLNTISINNSDVFEWMLDNNYYWGEYKRVSVIK